MITVNDFNHVPYDSKSHYIKENNFLMYNVYKGKTLTKPTLP